MVIDTHVHFDPRKGFVRDLLTECDTLGIDKVCLIGSSRELQDPLSEAPDRFIGLAMVRLGYDPPTVVDDLRERGIPGLKMINPR
ncbi:MAG: hypothetical protein V1800_07010 [Candidatus Latescibacterota bacterium]